MPRRLRRPVRMEAAVPDDSDLPREQIEERTVEQMTPVKLPPDLVPRRAERRWLNIALQVGMPIAAAFLALVVGGVIVWAAG